jgi:hypothetical protein
MARRIVPVLLLVAALAGYVAAQTDESSPGPPERAADGQGKAASNVRLYWRPNAEASLAAPPPGRYQLSASGERMLDTATGTLYAVSGQSWVAIATLPEGPAPVQADARGADRQRGRERLREVRRQFLASLAAAQAKRDAGANQTEAERQELEARVRTLQSLLQQIDKALGISQQPGSEPQLEPGPEQGE